MPQPETHGVGGYAVLWDAIGFDQNGEVVVGTEREIKVSVVKTMKESKSPFSSTARTMTTLQVNESISLGSKIWLGQLDEWYGTGTGSGESVAINQVLIVIGARTKPDIKGRMTRYEIDLGRAFENPG